MGTTPGLHKGLKQRQLNMIAIGGVIGAGLFVGSGVVINEAGPASFLTYAITGVLIILVMRMLGEMATGETGDAGDEYRHRSATIVTGDPRRRRRPTASRVRSTPSENGRRPMALCTAIGSTN